MTGRDRTFLCGQLASVGIMLGPATQPSSSRAPAASTEPPPVDRDEVCAILVAARAPAGDLAWLVASCTSVEDARSYRPPARQAWCVDCGGVTACDDLGCIGCRGGR